MVELQCNRLLLGFPPLSVKLMARSHCTEPGTGVGLGPGMGRMGYYIYDAVLFTLQRDQDWERDRENGQWVLDPFFCT